MHRSHNASSSNGGTSSNNCANEKRSYVDWGRFWFAQLPRHDRGHDPAKWSFAEEDVIAFLRSKVKAGVPGWKRVLIVKGLIVYRNHFLRSKYPKLEQRGGFVQEVTSELELIWLATTHSRPK